MTFEYIRQSLFFFRTNIIALASINLPFIVVSYFLMEKLGLTSVDQTPHQLVDNMLTLSYFNTLFMPLFWGASIVFMQSTLSGTTYTASQALLASLKIWFKLFLVFIIYTLCLTLGLLAFILPGIYIAIRLSIADYICVIEKESPLQSIIHSWKRTEDYVWQIFQGLAIILVSIMLFKLVMFGLLDNIFEQMTWLTIPFKIVFELLNLLILIYGFRIYCIIKGQS